MRNENHTQIERLSEWSHALRFEDLPPGVVELARLQVLDALSAICSGASSKAGIRLRRGLEKMESGGPCTALTIKEQWSPESTVYWHSSMINALELDNFAFMGHFTESSFSVALAVSELLKRTTDDFLLAIVAAQEAAGRISAYFSTGKQQGHMRAFVHRIAGAVAASKLLGLDVRETALALATALSMPEFPFYAASYSADTKVICTAAPAVQGMRAAFLAAEGLDAPLDIIEHPLGLLANFSYLTDCPDIWGKLGQSWLTHTLSFKKFATCAYAQGAVQAAVIAHSQGGFEVGDIKKVEVFCPLTTVVLEAFSEPHYHAGITPVNTHFSTKRSVAAALTFGALTGSFFAGNNFENYVSKFQELTGRVQLIHDWELSIRLLKGIDQGLEGAGKPGLMSTGSADTTFNKLKTSHGSRGMFQWKDIIHLMKINRSDRYYFLRRIGRSLRGKIPVWPSNEAKRNYRSTEGDLEAMVFSMGGRVRITLNNGQKQTFLCRIPSGFAGDPDRKKEVVAKYFREVVPVWGRSKTQRVEKLVRTMECLPIHKFSEVLRQEPAGVKMLNEI